MIPGKQYTPELVLSIAWRRKWLILIPAVIVVAIGVAVTYSLPDQFRSEMSILVVPQQVPQNYVRSVITTKVEERLRSINQQVRSRTKLERIIDDFNLYPERRKRDIMQDIVDDMSDKIAVEITQNDVFSIAFTSDSPRAAQQVTERLGTFFVDESLKDRAALAENASEFLDSQVADAARKLRDTDHKLAEFKLRHDGELPNQVGTNQQGLLSSQGQLQSVGLALDRDREAQQSLQRKIDDLTAVEEAAVVSPIIDQQPGVPPSSKAGQLAAARAQLKTLLTQKRRGHPDVDTLERSIAKLEREAAEEAAGQTVLGRPAPPANPIAARRAKDLEDTRADLARTKRQIDSELAQQKKLTQAIQEYQRRMEAAPMRDTELVDLTRDYGTIKQAYDSLSAKKIESQISADLERRQIGEQFRILDPPRLPEKPSSPNRERMYLISVILAIIVGLGAAAIAEYLDRGLRSEDDVRLALALPVLATIPVIGGTPKNGLMKRWKLLAGSAVVMVAVAAGAAWFVLR